MSITHANRARRNASKNLIPTPIVKQDDNRHVRRHSRRQLAQRLPELVARRLLVAARQIQTERSLDSPRDGRWVDCGPGSYE